MITSVDLDQFKYKPTKFQPTKPKLNIRQRKPLSWLVVPSTRNPYYQKPKVYKTKISAALKRQVWETYIGKKYEGDCFCCKRTKINVFDFHNGHVEAEARGGSTNLSNLRPICALCNYSSGTHNMFEFAQNMGFSDRGTS